MNLNKLIKKLADALAKASGVQLAAYSGVFLTVVFLINGMWGFAQESFLKSSGKLETVTLTVEDFEQVALQSTQDGSLVSTDGDCQLLLKREMLMSGVAFTAEYSVHPGEVTMYYTTKDGQGFSATKRYRFFPVSGQENRYEISFGAKKMKSIRIDPTTAAGNNMKITEITINAPKTLGSFFAVGYGDIFNLLVYSGIIAACLGFVKEMVIKKTN